ncbi:MAG: hypothetical protein AB7O96_13245, partial [Pseudobdellovibrionaceae bacterium]
MKWKHSTFKQILNCLATFALLMSFQNCTPSNFQDQNSTDNKAEGGVGGVDGKLYRSYGVCSAQNQSEIVNAVRVSLDGLSAKYVRLNCDDLSQPQSIPIQDLSYALGNSQVFTLTGKVYDQQLEVAKQEVTVQLCTGSSGRQARVW